MFNVYVYKIKLENRYKGYVIVFFLGLKMMSINQTSELMITLPLAIQLK